MGRNKTFEIAFGGLKNGVHRFELKADNAFFQSIKDSPIQQGDVDVVLDLNKSETHMELDFQLKGTIHTECDRCLAQIEYPIKSEEHLVIKLGEEFDDENPDLLILPRQENQVNLSQYVYEYILLALPMQRFCADTAKGSCDPEMLNKVEFLDTPPEDDSEQDEDTRWDNLRNFLN